MRTFLAVAAIAALGTATLAWVTHGGRALTAETARRLAVRERPVAVPDLRLEIQTGREVRLQRLEGELVVATFMYTRCRTMCPLLGQRLARIRERLPEAAIGREVRLLSLSFDPDHDGPQRLRAWAARYRADPQHWWVARPLGPPGPVLERFGVVVLPDGRGGFTHNAAFYLIDRRGRLVRIVDDRRPGRMVRAVERRL
jgi:protein SCO1/2